MAQVRIALTISGAVSVGAFEGGALAALLTAVQAIQRGTDLADPPIRIDAIGGASAGAMTAVAAAAVLTLGLDPMAAMIAAWVNGPDIEKLLAGADWSAPLSMAAVTRIAETVLKLEPTGPQQRSEIQVRLALANLRGLNYQIKRLDLRDAARMPGAVREPITGTTYLDWSDFTFLPGDEGVFGRPEGQSAVDAGRASGANQFGFPPQMLVRESARYKAEDAHLILENFPGGEHAATADFWFSDGGTLANEPIGRTLDLTNKIDGRDEEAPAIGRLVLLIHPFPDPPQRPNDFAWANKDAKPSWLQALLRAYKLMRAQNAFDDLRMVEKTNSRARWRLELDKALRDLVGNLDENGRGEWAARLSDLKAGIEADRRGVGARTVANRGTDANALLEDVLDYVTGLGNKRQVAVEVVFPQLAEGAKFEPTDKLLGGEFLMAFGGFLDPALRWNDFALGYTAMLNWMEAGLERNGLSAGDGALGVEAALKGFFAIPQLKRGGETRGFTGYGLSSSLVERAQAQGYQFGPSWHWKELGRITVSDLPLAAKLRVVNLFLRIAVITVKDVWNLRKSRGDPGAMAEQ